MINIDEVDFIDDEDLTPTIQHRVYKGKWVPIEKFKQLEKLESALDSACRDLAEFTELKCSKACSDYDWHKNKSECDDVCFFKELQTAEQWKEYLLNEAKQRDKVREDRND